MAKNLQAEGSAPQSLRLLLIITGLASILAFPFYVLIWMTNRAGLSSHIVLATIVYITQTPFLLGLTLLSAIPGISNLCCGISLSKLANSAKKIARITKFINTIYGFIFLLFALFLFNPPDRFKNPVRDLGMEAVIFFSGMVLFTFIGVVVSTLGIRFLSNPQKTS